MNRLLYFFIILSGLISDFFYTSELKLPDNYSKNVKVSSGVSDYYGVDNLSAAVDIKSGLNGKRARNSYDPDALAIDAEIKFGRKLSNNNEENKIKKPQQENQVPKSNESKNTTTIIREIVKEVPKETNVQKLQKGDIENHLNYVEDAKNAFSNIKSSIFADFPDIHDISHSSKNDSFDSESFVNTYGENSGKAQEANRKLINRICDPKEGGNIHVLVAAINSIAGVDGDKNLHSDMYMKREIDLENSASKEVKESLRTIFGNQEKVTPEEMIKKVEVLQAEILEKSAAKIDVTLLQEHLDAIYTVLAKDFDDYNKKYNSSGMGLSNKDDNMFLDLDKMNKYFEGEDDHLKQVKNVFGVEEEQRPSLDKVITHILDHIGDLPSDTGEYLNNEDSRDAYRKSTEQFISEAAKNPSQEMVHFLLNSVSTNNSGMFSEQTHNEKILEKKIEISVVMNNGKVEKQKVSIENAKKILESMPESEAKSEYARQIIEGIGDYYKENSNLGLLSKSEYGAHIVLDKDKFLQEHYSEHDTVQTNAAKAAIYNSSKNSSSNISSEKDRQDD